MRIDLEQYKAIEEWEEWHDVYSVTLGELIDEGVYDFSSEEWDFDCYNREQRDRLWVKFQARYRHRELGLLPPKRWQLETLRKLNEIMPKYKSLYALLDQGVNVMQEGSEYHKSRNVFSEYPQTALGGNQDYATNATDNEYETLRYGNVIDAAERLKRYDDVDVMILNELETMFSCIFTINLNAL